MRINALAGFWNAFDSCEELGAVNREVLEDLKLQVSDCIYGPKRDVAKAESLTAQALFALEDCGDL
jgi:hypothetical protein